MIMKTSRFWDITPCSPLKVNWRYLYFRRWNLAITILQWNRSSYWDGTDWCMCKRTWRLDTVVKWLRSWTANPMCYARVGSSLIHVGSNLIFGKKKKTSECLYCFNIMDVVIACTNWNITREFSRVVSSLKSSFRSTNQPWMLCRLIYVPNFSNFSRYFNKKCINKSNCKLNI
jgi:hypothetical protein